jgi:hypothetical protein
MAIRNYLTAGLVAFAILAAVLYVDREMRALNDQIDRCDDPTSGTYIQDPSKRAAECR